MNLTTRYRRLICALLGHKLTAYRKVPRLPEKRAVCVYCGAVVPKKLTAEEVRDYARRTTYLRNKKQDATTQKLAQPASVSDIRNSRAVQPREETQKDSDDNQPAA